MSVRPRSWRSKGFFRAACLILSSSAVFLISCTFFLNSCTTTLDPTTLDSPAQEEPEPVVPEPPLCGAQEALGGATFSSCVDLTPCEVVGEAGRHLLCAHELSYDAASHECRLRGGYLVEIDSAEENALVAVAAGQAVGTNVWLGGRRSETFVWAWEYSQTVFWRGDRNGVPEENVFVAWEPGEPNNTSTVSDEPEKCLVLTLGDVDWNDRACSLQLPFACELN